MHEKRFRCDLSGGLDTRISFCILKNSGINLKEIKIHSLNDNLSCHTEDFLIAKQIADYYNFDLNLNWNNQSSKINAYETVANTLCLKLGAHNAMFYNYGRHRGFNYIIPGLNGELIRGYPNKKFDDYKKTYLEMCKGLGKDREIIENSINTMWDREKQRLKEKYGVDENDEMLTSLFYSEGRARNHGGKCSYEMYFSNIIELIPCTDPILFSIKKNSFECKDNNLLMSIIFLRYCPKLIDFPVEGGRTFEKDTLEYAKKIHLKYHRRFSNCDQISHDYRIPDFKDLKDPQTNDKTTISEITNGVRDYFLSDDFKNAFCNLYSNDTYEELKRTITRTNYYPLRNVYAAIAIVRAAECIRSNSTE